MQSTMRGVQSFEAKWNWGSFSFKKALSIANSDSDRPAASLIPLSPLYLHIPFQKSLNSQVRVICSRFLI